MVVLHEQVNQKCLRRNGKLRGGFTAGIASPRREAWRTARFDSAALSMHWSLDEQGRRRFAAAEARALGQGGVTLVSKVAGIARSTINRGIAEIEQNRLAGEGGVRRPGGGRRPKTEEDPTLLDDLQKLLEASTRGEPMSPLLWTSKSLVKLCAALKDMQHDVFSERRRQAAAQTRLQPAEQPQDARGQHASRSGCAVPLPRPSNEKNTCRSTRPYG